MPCWIAAKRTLIFTLRCATNRDGSDSPNQENSQHQDREETENLIKILVHLAGKKLPDQFHPTHTGQISDVDVVAVRVHLKSHVAVGEGKHIPVPHLLKDQEPLDAENVKSLAVS